MCLKETYVITFSNKEAFDRALALLDNPKFTRKKIRGTFYKILRWNVNKKRLQPRNQLTFEHLHSFLGYLTYSSSFWIEVKEITFNSYRKLADAIGEVADHDDIFGKIEVELR